MDFKTHLGKYLNKDEINNLINSFSLNPKSAALINFNKINDEVVLEEFNGLIKHPIVPHAYIFDKEILPLGKHFLHDIGAYYISEPSALLVSHLLDINEDDLILDMCSAPGGKAIQAALKAKNGLIIANDIALDRCKTLANNIERMGLNNVIVTNNDLSIINPNLINKFDKIILDAPCSGSGMFRKDIKMMEDWTYQKVLKCKMMQEKLIDAAIKYLKPGGTLIYSTCSYSYEEDEEIIIDILNKYDDLELINIDEYEGFYRSKNLDKTIHLFPSLFLGEGHYIAKIKKKGELYKTNYKSHQDFKNFNKLNVDIKDYNNFINKDYIYLLNKYIELKNLRIIKMGSLCFENKISRIEPLYNLAKILPFSSSTHIEINKEETLKILNGETIDKSSLDGWFILSYKNIGVSYTKISNNICKNHYPKGLRKKY